MGGTYTLLIRLAAPTDIEVGALGTHRFEAGWYGYTGSALGAGGFSRIDRHAEVATGERDTRHWHIDYLLGHPDATLAADVRTEADVECAVARALPAGPVAGFGASDCDCPSHLTYAPDREALERAVESAHEQVR
ncbi:DUF123 domain-containing protein [Halosegnis longus]|uniref:DUF123 domain-containing protein n=1 Tax=Halosegnis longus TaxID=2216012 RepID=UPI00096A82A7|nr:GIY-YIG nuclease family protein [Salella cibi]